MHDSLDRVYLIYATLKTDGIEQLGVIMRGDGYDHISGSGMTTTTDSEHYRIRIPEWGLRPLDYSTKSRSIALVAYHPFAGEYAVQNNDQGRYGYRYSSEGPLSNFLAVPK